MPPRLPFNRWLEQVFVLNEHLFLAPEGKPLTDAVILDLIARKFPNKRVTKTLLGDNRAKNPKTIGVLRLWYNGQQAEAWWNWPPRCISFAYNEDGMRANSRSPVKKAWPRENQLTYYNRFLPGIPNYLQKYAKPEIPWYARPLSPSDTKRMERVRRLQDIL